MPRPDYDSRTADKFVVRLPDGLRSQVEQEALDDHRSMNSVIVQAIQSHLSKKAAQRSAGE